MAIDGNDISISKLFDDDVRFTIPRFQRSYDWEESEVKTWLKDIQEIEVFSNKKYFVGAVVYTESTNINEYYIIDGQQRLTTTFLVYLHINKIYNEVRSSESNRTLNNEIPKKIEIEVENEYVTKIKLNKLDEPFFHGLISDNSPDVKLDSHTKLKNANNCVENFCKGIYSDNGLEGLEDVVKSLKSFICMKVSVGDEIDAYQLFESMNDKGRALSKADLIKNYLFNKVSEGHHDRIEDQWEDILIHIKKAGYGFDNFLMYYLDGRYGKDIRESQIFTEFKERYNTSDMLQESINEIFDKSKNIDFFYNPDEFQVFQNLNQTNKDNFINVLKQLKTLKNTQYHIMVIPLLSFLDNNDEAVTTIEYLECMRNVLIKYIVCKRQTNELLPKFCSEAKKIYDGNDLDVEEFKNNINSNAPNREDFKQSISKFKSTNALSKMIFKSIFKTPNGLTYQDSEIWLEHIIPMKWSTKSEWVNYFQSLLDEYNNNVGLPQRKELKDFVNPLLSRIGNHALLYDDDNRSIKNEFYSTIKRDVFSRSEVGDARKIAEEYENFDESSIFEREQYISEQLIEEWNLY